jgi:spermidine/putrescine transport system substrate-binding protein
MLMDWYYDPTYAAMLTEWNAYFTPVPDGGEIVQADAAAAKGADKEVLQTIASSPYVFPTADFAARLHNYRVLEGDEVQTWNDIFNPIFLT